MDILALKGRIPNEVLESIVKRGITRLTPPQEEAINAGVAEGKNVIIASPTASGKTLVAEIACASAIISKYKKAVYIAPMRALVTEKYTEFKEAYPYLKTSMSIGDLDSSDTWLQNQDMLFVSTEKFDSLLRHGISWLNRIGCIVFDEIHMMGDHSRGPTLELLVTKLANTCDAQIVALSATIGNAEEIAEWLNARLVKNEYRPVKLKKGVVHDELAYYFDGPKEMDSAVRLLGSKKISELRVVEDTIAQSKQALVFYATKRNAEAGAVRLSECVNSLLTKEEHEGLAEVGDKILNTLERPTEQCMKLSNLVKKGVAFHHAGLVHAQRVAIENAFKSGIIKAVCSTTTLGLGVNMPAHTVLVKDITRYDGGASEMLSVNEVTQLFGRAGRPKYDKEGRALLIASTKDRIEELASSYINAKPEPIDSQLGMLPVLRTHILAFISENFLNTKQSIVSFLMKSFYGHQYSSEPHISRIVDEVTEELMAFEFIEAIKGEKGFYKATRLGKRVSELYVDPLSARWIINSLERDNDEIGILFTISNTLEMRPYVRATEEAEDTYVSRMHTYYNKSLLNEYERLDYGMYDPVRAMATALMLRDWAEEKKEQEIIKSYHTTPGEIFTKLNNADWMIYSTIELAKLMHKSVRGMVDMRVRLRYGIKGELLDLVRLEQIGRVRARMLYTNGIKTVPDIRKNAVLVEKLFGKELAKRILSQIP